MLPSTWNFSRFIPSRTCLNWYLFSLRFTAISPFACKSTSPHWKEVSACSVCSSSCREHFTVNFSCVKSPLAVIFCSRKSVLKSEPSSAKCTETSDSCTAESCSENSDEEVSSSVRMTSQLCRPRASVRNCSDTCCTSTFPTLYCPRSRSQRFSWKQALSIRASAPSPKGSATLRSCTSKAAFGNLRHRFNDTLSWRTSVSTIRYTRVSTASATLSSKPTASANDSSSSTTGTANTAKMILLTGFVIFFKLAVIFTDNITLYDVLFLFLKSKKNIIN